MKSVVSEDTCIFLARRDWFYVMHRFDTNQIAFIDKMHRFGHIASISMGVNEESYKQIDDIVAAKLKPEYITLDIASAWAPKAEKMVKHIKDKLPDSFLIVGNMAVAEAVQEIEAWGADCTTITIKQTI